MNGGRRDAAVCSTILGVRSEHRRQTSAPQRREPRRNCRPQRPQGARPRVQAIARDRTTGTSDLAPKTRAEKGGRERRHFGHRQPADLVETTTLPVRSPSANPADVRDDRAASEPAIAPHRKNRCFLRIAWRQGRKPRHTAMTCLYAEALPDLSCAIRGNHRRRMPSRAG